MSGSASRGSFSVTITAVDAATKQIDAINRNLKEMQAPAERLTNSFSKLAQTSGITALSRGMREVADSSFRAFENLGRLIAPLGVLTGAASIAGLSRLVTGFGQAGAELSRAGQRARISAGDLAAFRSAADLAGSSSSAMGAGIQTLNDNMFAAAQDTAPDAIIAFNTLHVAFKNADGSLRNVSDVLPEVIQKLSEIKDPTYRAQIATMLLGGATEALAPVLQLTRKQFEAYIDLAKQHGSITDEQAEKAKALDLAQRGLTAATQGLGNAISEQLTPVITPLLIDLTKWLDANRGIIATDLKGWIDTAIPGVVQFGKDANTVAQYFGGWKVALEAFGALIVGGWALRVVAGLNPLVLALAGIALTMEKISTFEERNAPANLPAGSPFWDPNDVKTNSNYLNSPQSQEFWNKNHPAPFSWLHPNTWLQRPPGSPTHPSPLAADTTMDPDQRALMDALSIAESGTAYDAKNPASSAHGRYQLIDSTDADVTRQTGIPGQDPVSQDRKGWYLAERDYRAATGRDLLTDWKLGKYAEVAAGLKKTWPSLPGGSQQNTTAQQWIVRSIDARAAEQQADRQAHIAATAPPAAVNVAAAAPPANVAGGAGAAPAHPQPQTQMIKGSADLKIKVSTDPGLTTKTTASTSGDVFSGAPKISQAMAY
jgi:hypothetical protein